MQTFLISFTYHTASDWALSEITNEPIEPRTSSLFITGQNEKQALAWAEDVAIRFMDYVNEGGYLGWREKENTCWVENDPGAAGLEEAIPFFQTVLVGETPNFDNMTTDAYMDWLEREGGDGI